MTASKTLLLTGGAGFIGNAFLHLAVTKGYRVVVLDAMTYAGHPENLEWIRAAGYGDAFELVVGNITDGALVQSLFAKHRFSAVCHFAAESHVDNSIARPAAFIETNILGSYTLLEAARAYWNTLEGEAKTAFRYLQLSTDEVYGSLGETGKFSETHPMQPNSPYSASKAAGDHLARAWHETYGLPTITTNCTNNYGPRQHPEKLIPLMITRALGGSALPVYGDGKNVRDWIQVNDHCHGVMLALEKGRPGEVYCFGGDAERNNLQVVHAICDVLDDVAAKKDGGSYRSQIAFVTDRLGHDRRYAMDDRKAQRELGFTRRHSFEQGLRETVEWYRANRGWCEAVTAKKAA